jgi:hypothetical protein
MLIPKWVARSKRTDLSRKLPAQQKEIERHPILALRYVDWRV